MDTWAGVLDDAGGCSGLRDGEEQGAHNTYHIQEDIDTVRLDDKGYECSGDGHGVNRAALDDDP